MAFNLQKVLKALLFSSSQPLAIKDIQAVFSRFHEQATLPLEAPDSEEVKSEGLGSETAESETPEPAGLAAESSSVGSEVEPVADLEMPRAENAGVGGASETPAEVALPADADIYQDVPSLVTAAQIREAMFALAAEIREENGIYLLIEGPTGYRLVTHPRFARWIRILRDEPPPVKLTQSALETLAIIAYRQPVTRTEIETIRGVSAEAGINKLLERDMVYIVGRADLPGRPLQYGTTDKFLEFVGVKSLVELPSSDVLSPRQIDEWLKNAINPKPMTDAEMGLPLEEGEGPSPNREDVAIEHEPAAENSVAENSAESGTPDVLVSDTSSSPIPDDDNPPSTSPA
ncbi:MAG TPA: SMC-Scp complex subunit ScpB [Opitutaceae bacterium]|nr:SMC-Scp complex subunit ScpB [Opitutaceae bacterium]